ncbi:TPA: hypothetical protein ACPTX5_004885 [Escherichia coli]
MKRKLIAATVAALLSGCVAQPVQPVQTIPIPKPEGRIKVLDDIFITDALKLSESRRYCRYIARGWVKKKSGYYPPAESVDSPIEEQQRGELVEACEAKYKREYAALWESQPQALKDYYNERVRIHRRNIDAAIEAEAQR